MIACAAIAGMVFAVCAGAPIPAAPLLVSAQRCQAVDGDTLRCGGELVRLMDFDSAEHLGHARCPRERRLGALAARRMARLAAGGLELEPHGREKYGRLLARAYAPDGRPVASLMATDPAGHSYLYNGRGPRRDWCRPWGGAHDR